MNLNNKKNYVCIFPGLFNYHLIKDVGLLPYTMDQFFHYNSSILTYNNDDYNYLNQYLKSRHFKLVFLEKNHKDEIYDVMSYLIRKSGDIDVLQIFHLNYNKILWYGLIYKLLNRKGKFYVKADANDTIVSFLVDRPIFSAKVRRKMFKLITRLLVDCLSIETHKNYEKLLKSNVIDSSKLLYLPNGVDTRNKASPNLNDKKNYIITVGSLGRGLKATEILLEAFAKIGEHKDWKLILVGKIDESFQAYIQEYFVRNPHLKDIIIFKGYISDRDEIYNLYAQSKIFCFPSRSESFGITLLEAAYNGNYLVTTDVGGAKDALDVINYGELIRMDDSDFLAKRLQELILNPEKFEKDPNKVRLKVSENYNWKKLCKKLYEKLI